MHLPRRITVLSMSYLVFVSVGVTAGPNEAAVIRLVDQAELRRESSLPGYSVTEEYSVRNSHFDSAATMSVEVIYTRGAGKSYRVLSRGGPAFLQTHVLDKMLQAEREMSVGEARRHAIITSANYKMRLLGAERVSGRPAYRLEIKPRAKSPYLIDGQLWVDAADGSVIRIEGEAAASPAFLAGRPHIDREYDKLDGFSLARDSNAHSSSFLLGKTELSIEYRAYRIKHPSL